MRSSEIKLEKLLLDPVNYRFQDEAAFKAIPADRYHLDQVQKSTLQLIKKSGIKELHDSIIANGFLQIERIVVVPYEHPETEGYFLVIEGNRRVAALRQIQDEINGGIEIRTDVAAILDGVPCIVFDDKEKAPYFRETLMGVRHVGGIKQWGGYQRAKLIADLRDFYNVEAPDVAAKLGLSIREVNRRYRAYKALQQMKDDEEFGDLAAPTLYPLFHEAVALPEVRDWLKWNQDTNKFEESESIYQFYELITPCTPDDGGPDRPAKLSTFSDIRQLRGIIGNPDAKRYLLDKDRSFVDALTIANREELTKKWRNELTEATASLEGISALEVRNFSTDDIALLDRLLAAATQIKEVYIAVKKS